MKFYLFSVISCILFFFTACSQTQPQADPNLPIVTQVKSIADIDSIAFEWQSIKESGVVQGYYIYRKDSKGGQFHRVAEIPSRFSSHFVDTGLSPNTTYIYRFATFNAHGSPSIASEPIVVKTGVLDAVEYAQAMSNYPRKVKLLWSPHADPRVNGYLIMRAEGAKFVRVAKIENRLQVEYIDEGLRDNTQYHYMIYALNANDIKSNPTSILTAKTKPLPLPPQGLTASMDLPRQIKISWQPSTQQDVVGYKVYRKILGGITETEIANLNNHTLHFIDTTQEDGVSYGYFVTAVDKDGLESQMQRNAIEGRTLSRPAPPNITRLAYENGRVMLQWSPSDSRAVQYSIYKQEDSFFGKREKYISVPNTYFYDSEVSEGESYFYGVIAIDKNGLESVSSKKRTIKIPVEAH
ncbi:hypothetical protein CCZ01_02340 [Helicobacter monodelphidis]|uniref:fibronectin type III domain-containing protein n=1 Tax=Helicobacter sp. 15-1451 TaxID=2004995 RepID=UPI000DCB3886|nr:fibronectin type III domain-containing protein [Helicobacter sp. 15-1451]RAX58642.1 hypothetical protein CCZ01_02340 [Helicobacter sp. 15-1451]